MSELHELLRELWTARRRLLPVVLGLCFGTVGLSLLLGFGDGFDLAMRSALARSGEAMLRCYAGGTSLPFAGRPAGRPVPLRADDAAVVRQVPGVTATAVETLLGMRVIGDGGRDANVTVAAVSADWALVRGFEVAPGGRFLSPRDEQERRRVAVVGAKIARTLFGDGDPIGRTVRVFDAPFVVVGVLPERPLLMTYGGEDALKVIVPHATVAAMRGQRYVGYVLARLADPSAARAVEAAVRAVLAGHLRFDPNDRPALGVSNHALQAGEIRGIIAGTRTFLMVIGVLGLLVAALGVANMAYVLVEERVREIGLRLALGATPRQVRWRQLLETAAIVAVGGGLGVGLAAVLLAAAALLPMPPEARQYLGVPMLSLAASAAITALLGLTAGIAGWHPAARAAAVQPVEALRHE